jgi:hypothetical protein
MASHSFHSKISGVSANNNDGRGRQRYIRAFCKAGTPLIFKREPNNPYDKDAVAAWIEARAFFFFTSEVQIGYLNAELAQEISRHLAKGGGLHGEVSEVTGGTRDKPTLGVNVLLTKY